MAILAAALAAPLQYDVRGVLRWNVFGWPVAELWQIDPKKEMLAGSL